MDTGKTLRRFIHRSIREHLVAEHVVGLPVNEATEALLPHLWFDRDWEYAAAAALAVHPQHDQLLRAVIRDATGSDQIPEDVSVIDGTWQFRALLARVASESSEADWSPEIAEDDRRSPGAARQSTLRRRPQRGCAVGNLQRPARSALLAALARETDSGRAVALANAVGARPDGGGQAPGLRRAA